MDTSRLQVECPCGSKIQASQLRVHCTSKKHLKFMKTHPEYNEYSINLSPVEVRNITLKAQNTTEKTTPYCALDASVILPNEGAFES